MQKMANHALQSVHHLVPRSDAAINKGTRKEKGKIRAEMLTHRPYAKMADILIFFCLHSNRPT